MSCPRKAIIGGDMQVTVDNRMGEPVYLFTSPYYPDTSLNSLGTNVQFNARVVEVMPGESEFQASALYGGLPHNASQWDTLFIFVFDSDVNRDDSWKEYKDGIKYLRRYQVTADSLALLKKFVIE